MASWGGRRLHATTPRVQAYVNLAKEFFNDILRDLFCLEAKLEHRLAKFLLIDLAVFIFVELFEEMLVCDTPVAGTHQRASESVLSQSRAHPLIRRQRIHKLSCTFMRVTCTGRTRGTTMPATASMPKCAQEGCHTREAVDKVWGLLG